MADDELARARARINELDEHILRLLSDRAATALKIGKMKAEQGSAVYDPGREGDVLVHIASRNRGPLGKGAVEDVFNTIITVCREIQISER